MRRILLPFVFYQDCHGQVLPITFLKYKVYLNTLDICLLWLLSCVRSGKSHEVSSPVLRVLLFFNVSGVFGGDFEAVGESSDCASGVFLKGYLEVSYRFLAVSAQDGFACSFRYTRGISALVSGI